MSFRARVEMPILFRPELVAEILAGRKVQTRRVVRIPTARLCAKDCKGASGKVWMDSGLGGGQYLKVECLDGTAQRVRCPYGSVGDRLWVRETWRPWEDPKTCIDGIIFKADESFHKIRNTKEAADRWLDARGEKSMKVWRPSIFMPRWACRLELEMTEIRVQRLQDTTPGDAAREGIKIRAWIPSTMTSAQENLRAFREGWDRINKDRGFGWDANPWVWAITFKRVT